MQENVVVPPLNRARETEANYDLLVLEAKALYSYTIPSFYAIELQLRHVYIRTEDETGVNYYVFFHEFPGCSNLQLPHPTVVSISNGCIVEVCETYQICNFLVLKCPFFFAVERVPERVEFRAQLQRPKTSPR